MTVFNELIAFLWVLWLLYWLFSAVRAKKSIGSNRLWYGSGFRIALIIILLVLLRMPFFHQFYWSIHSVFFYSNPVIDSIGVFFCAGGLALAIWARFYLGRNWGMPMTMREKPELVTSGPYTFIRHPIYTGIIIAMFGTALVNGAIWLVAFAFITAYFMYSIKFEEKYMSKQFPKEYPSYMKRTKALIPYVF